MDIVTLARMVKEILFSDPAQALAVGTTANALYGWLGAKVKGRPIEKELEAVAVAPTKESVDGFEAKLAEVLTEDEELRRELEGRQEIRVYVDNSTKISQKQNIHGDHAKGIVIGPGSSVNINM
jgi:hypothetical protein